MCVGGCVNVRVGDVDVCGSEGLDCRDMTSRLFDDELAALHSDVAKFTLTSHHFEHSTSPTPSKHLFVDFKLNVGGRVMFQIRDANIENLCLRNTLLYEVNSKPENSFYRNSF